MPHRKTNSAQDSAARDQKSRAAFFVGNKRSPIRERFGAAVRAQRIRIGKTQEELAAAAGINRTYLSEIENGRENISLERAERLAMALGCELVDLIQQA